MEQKLILEIKSIAKEIENTDTIETTLIKDKISLLHEKLIILQFLEKNIDGLTSKYKKDETKLHNSYTKNKTIEVVKDVIPKKTNAKAPETPIFNRKTITKQLEKPHTPKKNITPRVSINQGSKNKMVQIGLNDRIAFVKKLFDGKQQDFNRVLSQVNSFSNMEEVNSFINNYVKPEYEWGNKEEYVDRFMSIIETKFN